MVDDEVYTTERGFRRWTSVLGAMTGMGGDVFIIDDPLKPVDALSEVKREAVNQWYINTLLSRLDNKETGIILVVMQRVHQDDLSGYLLRDSEDVYEHLELPAIAEILPHRHLSFRKLNPDIMVMQPVQNRPRRGAAEPLDRVVRRRVLCQHRSSAVSHHGSGKDAVHLNEDPELMSYRPRSARILKASTRQTCR